MSLKTRYLQVSETMMFEYKMLGENDICDIEPMSSINVIGFKDGHVGLMSPMSYEVEEIEHSDGKYRKRKNPITLNTLNNLAVPKDSKCSMWYHFLDPDYEYVTADAIDVIPNDYIKTNEYRPYVTNPDDPGDNPFGKMFSRIEGVRWDTARLYFINGYDFSDIYGILLRLTISSTDYVNNTERKVDLCNFFFNRSNAYMYVKFLPTPIIFGNGIYDRYIDINVACVYDLINGVNDLQTYLGINYDTTIRMSFSYVIDQDAEEDEIQYSVVDVLNDVPLNDNVNCTFTRTSVINGTIPIQNVNSDNLGCYIAECTDMPYLKFYATWKDEPLTKDIVWRFNKGIRLYDTSLVRKYSPYEVDEDYTVEHDEKKWMCTHELKLSFCVNDVVIKEEKYNMTQVFISDSDPVEFYYRPLIFNDVEGFYINNIRVVYTMRFINVEDRVQFMKMATLSLVGDTAKYYAKGTNLGGTDLIKYKVFNKIVENRQESPQLSNFTQRTKYIKVFYNSTDVILEMDGNAVETNYTMPVSQAPKTYKFTFKKLDSIGKYTSMDLTDGSYKLYFKDAFGNPVVVDPTYSNNMNMYLGEVEFNITAGMIARLTDVKEEDRKMSIVSYNDDGSVSSMYDFKYSL